MMIIYDRSWLYLKNLWIGEVIIYIESRDDWLEDSLVPNTLDFGTILLTENTVAMRHILIELSLINLIIR